MKWRGLLLVYVAFVAAVCFVVLTRLRDWGPPVLPKVEAARASLRRIWSEGGRFAVLERQRAEALRAGATDDALLLKRELAGIAARLRERLLAFAAAHPDVEPEEVAGGALYAAGVAGALGGATDAAAGDAAAAMREALGRGAIRARLPAVATGDLHWVEHLPEIEAARPVESPARAAGLFTAAATLYVRLASGGDETGISPRVDALRERALLAVCESLLHAVAPDDADADAGGSTAAAEPPAAPRFLAFSALARWERALLRARTDPVAAAALLAGARLAGDSPAESPVALREAMAATRRAWERAPDDAVALAALVALCCHDEAWARGSDRIFDPFLAVEYVDLAADAEPPADPSADPHRATPHANTAPTGDAPKAPADPLAAALARLDLLPLWGQALRQATRLADQPLQARALALDTKTLADARAEIEALFQADPNGVTPEMRAARLYAGMRQTLAEEAAPDRVSPAAGVEALVADGAFVAGLPASAREDLAARAALARMPAFSGESAVAVERARLALEAADLIQRRLQEQPDTIRLDGLRSRVLWSWRQFILATHRRELEARVAGAPGQAPLPGEAHTLRARLLWDSAAEPGDNTPEETEARLEAAIVLARRGADESGGAPAARLTLSRLLTVKGSLLQRRAMGRDDGRPDMGRLLTATTAFKEAVRAAPDNAEPMDALLALWRMSGQRAKARDFLAQLDAEQVPLPAATRARIQAFIAGDPGGAGQSPHGEPTPEMREKLRALGLAPAARPE